MTTKKASSDEEAQLHQKESYILIILTITPSTIMITTPTQVLTSPGEAAGGRDQGRMKRSSGFPKVRTIITIIVLIPIIIFSSPLTPAKYVPEF